jgi:hypothetical protein
MHSTHPNDVLLAPRKQKQLACKCCIYHYRDVCIHLLYTCHHLHAAFQPCLVGLRMCTCRCLTPASS